MFQRIKTWLHTHCTDPDVVASQRACILMLINSAGCVLSLFVGLFTLYYQDRPLVSPQVWTAFMIAGGMAASAIILLRGSYRVASHVSVFVTFAAIWILVIHRTGEHVHVRSELVYVIAVLTLPALLLGIKWALIYGASSIGLAAVAGAHLTMIEGYPSDVAVGVAVDIAVGSAFVVFVTVIMCRIYEIALGRVRALLSAEEEYATNLQRAEAQKQQFYRETIHSVTGGKLCIYEEGSEIEAFIQNATVEIETEDPGSLADARHRVSKFCADNGLQGPALDAFVIGVGEAITNAVRHAGGGKIYAGRENGSLWAGASDAGPGIESLILPKALLMAGFSTKHSLGLGYTIMLDVSDKVLLNTSEIGTTVVLVKNLGGTDSRPLLDNWQDL